MLRKTLAVGLGYGAVLTALALALPYSQRSAFG